MDEKMSSAGKDDEMWLGLACVVCKELVQSFFSLNPIYFPYTVSLPGFDKEDAHFN